jgi:uncharacterized protein YbbC (DUF1343 family)
VDVLKKAGVNIKVIFGPEHGFRGTAEAGEKVESGLGQSYRHPRGFLYGKKEKPSKEDVQGVDVLLFDIQDVGRAVLHLHLLAPGLYGSRHPVQYPTGGAGPAQPNGFYVDGPVLEPRFKSFIGMQPVPVVYGMTYGRICKDAAGRRLAAERSDGRVHAKRTGGHLSARRYLFFADRYSVRQLHP